MRTLQALAQRARRRHRARRARPRSSSPTRYDTMEVRMASCVLASLLACAKRRAKPQPRESRTPPSTDPRRRLARVAAARFRCAVAGMIRLGRADRAPSRFLPFLAWRERVTRGRCAPTRSPGSIGALVVLPQGVAFATLAGLPPQYGLYARWCRRSSPRCSARRGTWSRGPTNAMSLVVFATIAPLAAPAVRRVHQAGAHADPAGRADAARDGRWRAWARWSTSFRTR